MYDNVLSAVVLAGYTVEVRCENSHYICMPGHDRPVQIARLLKHANNTVHLIPKDRNGDLMRMVSAVSTSTFMKALHDHVAMWWRQNLAIRAGHKVVVYKQWDEFARTYTTVDAGVLINGDTFLCQNPNLAPVGAYEADEVTWWVPKSNKSGFLVLS